VTLKKLILVILLFKFFEVIVYAHWERVNGPIGGDVTCIETLGSDFYAGTNGSGIFKSTDSGLTWIAVNTGLTGLFITSLVQNNSVLFALCAETGVYSSSNAGLSWQRFVRFGSQYYLPTSMSIYGSGILIADRRLYYSYDLGNNWFGVITGPFPTEKRQSTAFVSNMFLVGRYGEGIYRSINQGQDWSLSNDGLGNLYVNTLITIGNVVYTATEGGIYRSSNLGLNWTSLNSGLANVNVKCLSINGTNFFAGTNRGVYKSTNSGQDWVQTSFADKLIKSVMAKDNIVMAGSSGGGLFRSSDYGQNWTSVDTFVFKPVSVFLTKKNNVIYCSTRGCGIYISSDNGTSWKESNNGLTNLDAGKIVIDDNYLFAGTNGHGVFRSSDNGQNWMPVNSGRSNFIISDLHLSNGKVMSGTIDWNDFYNQVLLSSDAGQTWQNVWPQIEYSGFVVYTVFIKDNDLYTGGRFKNYGGLYKTTNNGLNWSRVTSYIVQNLNYYDSVFIAGTNNGIIASSNNGNNWNAFGSGLPQYSDVNSIIKDGSNLYASIFYGYGIFRSTDNGLNWNSFNEGFTTNQLTTCLLRVYDQLFVTTENNGIWKRSLLITSGSSNSNTISSNFSLFQNYPNPFNPTTKIKYELRIAGYVEIKIFDIMGKEVAKLVNTKQTAGSYSVEFSASKLASGIYLYSLIADGVKLETKKCLLVK
jgi:photosystem II stability/assembly factor-like uncharacterized protein